LYVAAVDFSIFNKKTIPILWITLLAASLNLTLNVLFIPYFGVWAAVWATMAAYLSLPILGFFVIKENREMRKKIRPGYLVLFTALMAWGCYSMFHIGIYLRLLISVVILLLAVVIYHAKMKQFFKLINHE
jgi:O-antigen/teichoic acid export membrane protein